ncbi:hypothetical protein J4573_32290 [Actinomadura barringtoniae]|uniref:DUF4064 domain-containing protein n=1 Tax=Actinomadura barringtoniae TaxID=1427535 RepID=A0A939T3W9_9ACTN|nr:hypothetical protein [Actinomadura barringtoniae]MBO2451806.1 hypothetical protein [Actinomadura barringtoniae]
MYQYPPASPGVRGPATALIVVGSINVLAGVLSLLSTLARIGNGERVVPDSGRDAAYVAGYLMTEVSVLISLVIAPLVIVGGINMLRVRSRGLALTAAVLAMVPVTSCCFIAGIPIGIWALVVLSKPEVKAAFDATGQPPPPSQPPPAYYGY